MSRLPQLVAHGLDFPTSLAFDAEGTPWVAESGLPFAGAPSDRRPIGNAPDLLFEVRPGAWYGWPDFVGGAPVTDPRFQPTRAPAPESLWKVPLAAL
jgi:glucose/arabinose dehydrogenase